MRAAARRKCDGAGCVAKKGKVWRVTGPASGLKAGLGPEGYRDIQGEQCGK